MNKSEQIIHNAQVVLRLMESSHIFMGRRETTVVMECNISEFERITNHLKAIIQLAEEIK